MSAVLRALTAPAAEQIRRWVLGAFPRGHSSIEYDQPLGDAGIFGPDSVTWRVHSEFPGMLSGGLCALMLQLLHPRALAGVYDHSNFRADLIGRLRRTTNFVASTTYAPLGEAEQLIARVRNIHSHIHGHTANGVPYHANDPELLTWVHVTEAYGFLQGCRRYCREVPTAIADRYYDEARRVADALGATDVPASQAQVDAYFANVRGQLRMDARAREVLDILTSIQLPVPAAGLSRGVFLGAGTALLPSWASDMLGRTMAQRVQALASARLLRSLSPLFRTALRDGLSARACHRMQLPPAMLLKWPGQALGRCCRPRSPPCPARSTNGVATIVTAQPLPNLHALRGRQIQPLTLLHSERRVPSINIAPGLRAEADGGMHFGEHRVA